MCQSSTDYRKVDVAMDNYIILDSKTHTVHVQHTDKGVGYIRNITFCIVGQLKCASHNNIVYITWCIYGII